MNKKIQEIKDGFGGSTKRKKQNESADKMSGNPFMQRTFIFHLQSPTVYSNKEVKIFFLFCLLVNGAVPLHTMCRCVALNGKVRSNISFTARKWCVLMANECSSIKYLPYCFTLIMFAVQVQCMYSACLLGTLKFDFGSTALRGKEKFHDKEFMIRERAPSFTWMIQRDTIQLY